jgi:flagellar basal body rod protein FlgG
MVAGVIMDLSIPTGGINRAQSVLDSSASQIARAATDDSVDLAKEVVKQIEGSQSLKANAKVVKTYDNMMGTLLDMVG